MMIMMMMMIASFSLVILLSILSIISADQLNKHQHGPLHTALLHHYDHKSPSAAVLSWMNSVPTPFVHSHSRKKLRGTTPNEEYNEESYVLNEIYRLKENDKLLQVSGFPLNTCICSSGSDGASSSSGNSSGSDESSLKCALASVLSGDENDGGLTLITKLYEGNYCMEESPTTTQNTPLSSSITFNSTICNQQTELSVSFEVIRGATPYNDLGPGLASIFYGQQRSCEHDQWARYNFIPNFECFCNVSTYGIPPEDYRYVEFTDNTCSVEKFSQVSHFNSSACIGQKTQPSVDNSAMYYLSVHVVLPSQD